MCFNECNKLLNSQQQYGSDQNNFFEYVYKKMSAQKLNRYLVKNEDCIDMIPISHNPIKIIPINKNIDINNLNIREDILKATNFILENNDFQDIYLVYPKNDSFNKHILLKVNDLEKQNISYSIKLIPYSLNSLKRRVKSI